MSCLIGGAGSSGTTLLRVILDNHPNIFSGPEISLFNKERLYKKWNENKIKLLHDKSGLSTDGWFPYPSNHLLAESYGWTKIELIELINQSSSIWEFVERYFERPLQSYKKNIWIEKTPSNTYGFRYFLEHSEKLKVVHMIRNPYDAVTSLVKRNMSPFFAAGLWVYNNSTGASVYPDYKNQYKLIKYENLVSLFDSTIESILEFIGVQSYDTAGLVSSGHDSQGILSWNHNPSGEISNKSVGSFNKLNETQQELIKQALCFFRIRKKIMEKKVLKYDSAIELCEVFGYEFLPPKSFNKTYHTNHLFKDFAMRSIKNYSTGWNNYPGSLKLG
jgi:hypothetical protein